MNPEVQKPEVKEPDGAVRFRFDVSFPRNKKHAFKYAPLVRHVMKHVLDSPEELWENIVSLDNINEAIDICCDIIFDSCFERRAKDYIYPPEIYQQLFQNSAFQSVCQSYESKVSNFLQQGCQSEIGHIHVVKIEDSKVVSQIIYYGNDEKRLIIITEAFVRNGKTKDYSISTAYRCCLSSDPASLKMDLKDRVDRHCKKHRENYEILAIHDEQIKEWYNNGK